MKFISLFFFLIILSNCSKPKTVLICGDHICVNKKEAEHYFEENLSIEVRIIDKKIKKEPDLIELNLSENSYNRKQVNIFSKKKTNSDLRVLSNEEVSIIKKKVKNKKENKRTAKKIVNNKKKLKKKISTKSNINDNIRLNENSMGRNQNKVTDICSILKECSINEISKYLLKQGKKRDFPDITTRQ